MVTAFTCGAIGVVLVEVSWWVTGRVHGEHRRLFAASEDLLPGVH
jgi:cation-transporting ATPase E